MLRPGLPRGVLAGRRGGQVVQGGGDIITPLPDRVLGWAQLQGREHQDIDREPGDHPDTHVDQPGGEIVQRLVAAYQQHEQRREGNLRALPAQSAPAADHHPGQHDHCDARDRRTQHQGHRNRQHGAEHEPGHVLDALAQGPGHRGGYAQQRRKRSEVRILLARRVPGQRPGRHRSQGAFGSYPAAILPVPDRPGRRRLKRRWQPRPPRRRAASARTPDHLTALHAPQLPANPQIMTQSEECLYSGSPTGPVQTSSGRSRWRPVSGRGWPGRLRRCGGGRR